MDYPLISEYMEAIKAAEENFDELKYLHPVFDEDGNPVMSSGNFAVVFKMKNEQTGNIHAVKCFLKEQEGRAEAYRQIAEELEYISSTFLTSIKYKYSKRTHSILSRKRECNTFNQSYRNRVLYNYRSKFC